MAAASGAAVYRAAVPASVAAACIVARSGAGVRAAGTSAYATRGTRGRAGNGAIRTPDIVLVVLRGLFYPLDVVPEELLPRCNVRHGRNAVCKLERKGLSVVRVVPVGFHGSVFFRRFQVCGRSPCKPVVVCGVKLGNGVRRFFQNPHFTLLWCAGKAAYPAKQNRAAARTFPPLLFSTGLQGTAPPPACPYLP